MIIRGYQPSHCKELTEQFYYTVHTANAKDYTKEQLDVWATGQVDLEKWNQSLQEYYSVVAIDDEIIVSFGDIEKTGYLDRLFVHADCQGKGIATAICNQLEQKVGMTYCYSYEEQWQLKIFLSYLECISSILMVMMILYKKNIGIGIAITSSKNYDRNLQLHIVDGSNFERGNRL